MDLYDIFEQLNIDFQEIEHEPVFTVEQAQEMKNKIDGTGCKNLFLTDKKGKYVLALLDENKRANIRQIEKIAHTSHLSFANSSKLKNILQLEQGSVTPLGVVNDKENQVLLVIDSDLKDKKLLLHPNTNTKTVSMAYDDLIKFIEHEKHTFIFLEGR